MITVAMMASATMTSSRVKPRRLRIEVAAARAGLDAPRNFPTEFGILQRLFLIAIVDLYLAARWKRHHRPEVVVRRTEMDDNKVAQPAHAHSQTELCIL